MKKILIITLLIFSVAFVHAQDTQKKSRKERRAEREAKKIEDTKTLIESKSFVFVPSQAIPTGMRSVTLTSSFDAKIKNDSIFCYLPYFGTSHTATYGSNQSPMDFNLPIIKYSSEPAKKGGWTVKFDVKNKMDLLNFTFQIAETGSSSLSVFSTSRAAISYYGEIIKVEEE